MAAAPAPGGARLLPAAPRGSARPERVEVLLLLLLELRAGGHQLSLGAQHWLEEN